MSLARYAVEADGLREELNEILDRPAMAWAWKKRQQEGDAWLISPSADELAAAEKLLGKTPRQREQTLKKLPIEQRTPMILHARELARIAKESLDLADRLQFTVGQSYRKATVGAASMALSAKLSFNADKMVSEFWKMHIEESPSPW